MLVAWDELQVKKGTSRRCAKKSLSQSVLEPVSLLQKQA